MEIKLTALIALCLIWALIRLRRRVLTEEAVLNACLAELRRRKEIELCEFAEGARFGEMSRRAK